MTHTTIITRKEFLHKKYLETKKLWSAAPIDPQWLKFAEQALEEYAQIAIRADRLAAVKEVRSTVNPTKFLNAPMPELL